MQKNKSILNHLFNKLFIKENLVTARINNNLEIFEVNNWSISKFIIKKIIPVIGIQPFPLSELQLMVAVLCWSDPPYVFDWGTNTGKSARVFYETVKYFNLRSKVISIDLPDDQDHAEHPGKSRGMYVRKHKEVQLLQGDGVSTALKVCKKNKVSEALFFLDGDHEYKSIKRELSLISKNIKNPKILIHDTFFQSRESNYNIGPHKAVKEFLNKNKKYVPIETKLGLPGMMYIYKK